MSNLLFGLAALGYWGAAIGFQYNLFHRKQRDWTHWLRLLLTSHVVHTAALLTLTIRVQHFPVSNMAEVLAVLGWALIALYAILGRRWKVQALGGIAAPAAAVLTTFSTFALGHEGYHPYKSAWFPLHVGSLVASYAAFCLAAFCSLLYFIQSKRLKQKKLNTAFLLPSLDTLDRVGFRFILVGFPLLVLGMVCGTQMPGWQWTWDAKETLVGLTGAIYVVYLHLRVVAGWQGRRINMILLVAFLCVLVSLLAPGRSHGY
ncbi:cytochrome c biogenesis protein CcsA [bacterium]|nr:cytochrome c biogenesis protein CcsA [bacterium]